MVAEAEAYRFLPVLMAAGLEKWSGLKLLEILLVFPSLLVSYSFEEISPAMLAFAINAVMLDLSFSAISAELSALCSMAYSNSLL